MIFTTASSGIDANYSSEIKLAQAPVSIKANLLTLWKTTGTRNKLYVLCLLFISLVDGILLDFWFGIL